jgi:hypothetical protein
MTYTRLGFVGCLFLFANVVSVVPATFAQTAVEVQMPELRRELLERRERDQTVRNALIKSGAENPDPKIRDEMRTIDRENTERMKEIVHAHGWPGPELVGRDGTQAAWLLVQHSTPEFQREMLPLVEQAYREKKLPGSNYALLLDRVRVHQGKPQVYGSQGRWENGVLGLQPIEDEANVDKRRAEVGLGPLADYLAGMRSMYNSKPPPGATAGSSTGSARPRSTMMSSDFIRLVDLEKRHAEAVAELNAADEKDRAAKQSQESQVSQQLSWARSAVGDYAGALSVVRRPNQSAPGDYAARARELMEGFQARDALEAIVEAARDRQIVILNEAHHLARHRVFALQLARELRALGFQYLACEAFNSNLDSRELQTRGYPRKADGFYMREPLFGDFVRHSLALGYTPVAYEHSGGGSPGGSQADGINNRETGQANNLVARILKDNPRARIFIFVGYSHLMKRPQNRTAEPSRTVQWMAGRLKDTTGIDPLTIDQVTMTDPDASSLHAELLRQLFDGGDRTKSSLVLRHATEAKQLVLGTYAGDVDMQVFHRPTAYVDGRPDWLAMNGYRKARAVPPEILPKSGRRLVQAFIEGETVGAIAVDQFVVEAGADSVPVFMLPAGKFRFAYEE